MAFGDSLFFSITIVSVFAELLIIRPNGQSDNSKFGRGGALVESMPVNRRL